MLALLLAAPRPVYDVGIVEESRAASDGQLAVQLSPSLQLAAGPRSVRGTLRYAPRFVYDRPAPGPGFAEAIQRATTSLEARPSSRARLFATALGEYGRTDLSPVSALAEGALPSLQLPSLTRSIRFAQLDATLGAEERLSRRLLLIAAGSYGVSGGARTQDRATLPLQRSARLRAALQFNPDSRDSWSLGLLGSQTRVGAQASPTRLVEAGLTWERRFQRSLIASLGGGLAFARQPGAAPRNRNVVDPTASAGLRGATLRNKLHLSIQLRLVPFVEPFDGSVQLRPEAAGQAQWDVARTVSLAAAAAAAPLILADHRRRIFGAGSMAAVVRPWKDVHVSAGVRLAAQPDVRATVFVGLSLTHHAPLW